MKKQEKISYQLFIKKWAIQGFLIVLGTAVMAVATSLFLLPNHLSTGGVSGIATITYYLFHWKMGTVIFVFNIPLLAMAWIRIGKQFFIKCILGILFLSLFINIFERYPALTNDKILASIYGGILIGIGTSIILRAEASTGGSDLFTYILRSYYPKLGTSTILTLADAVVIAMNVLCFQQLEIGLYSAISIYIMGKVIDIVFEGVGFSKMIWIISKDSEQIANKISSTVARGVTGFYSKGMYTKEKKLTLLCIASRREVIEIKRLVLNIDPYAFMMITNVREVYGKGFKKAEGH